MARNPYANRYKLLGVSQADYDAAKTAVIAYLQTQDAQAEVADALVRAQHAALAPPADPRTPTPVELVRQRTWNELKKELGL